MLTVVTAKTVAECVASSSLLITLRSYSALEHRSIYDLVRSLSRTSSLKC